MEGYSVKIRETSRELTAKERVMLKDTSDAVKLDTVTTDAPVLIDVDMYAILDIHNEKSDNKDYANYLVVDKDGTKYVTGSYSFWSSFINIYTEMSTSDEPYNIKVYKLPSKNRQGKDFITCSIV